MNSLYSNPFNLLKLGVRCFSCSHHFALEKKKEKKEECHDMFTLFVGIYLPYTMCNNCTNDRVCTKYLN